MEQLHAAIAAYLREHNRFAENRRRSMAQAERPLSDTERARQLFGYAEGRYAVPRCLICGRPVDDDGGLFNLQDMQTRRQCAEHYCPF